MIIIIAVLAGICGGLMIPYDLTSSTLPYVAIALLAALDSVFGGITANIKRTFNINIFITGFFSNAILAALLTYVGDLLGINISFAAVIVFGTRIFGNLAEIRHLMIDRIVHRKQYAKYRKSKKEPPMLALSGSCENYDESEEFGDYEKSLNNEKYDEE